MLPGQKERRSGGAEGEGFTYVRSSSSLVPLDGDTIESIFYSSVMIIISFDSSLLLIPSTVRSTRPPYYSCSCSSPLDATASAKGTSRWGLFRKCPTFVFVSLFLSPSFLDCPPHKIQWFNSMFFGTQCKYDHRVLLVLSCRRM